MHHVDVHVITKNTGGIDKRETGIDENRRDHVRSERWVTARQQPLASHLLSSLDELKARVRPDVASTAGHQNSRRKSHDFSAVH